MILNELKKIWTPVRVVTLIIVSVLMWTAFLNPVIKRFESVDGIDAFGESIRISKEWIKEYSETIEREEFAEIKNEYDRIITEIEKSMLKKTTFTECQVESYEAFLTYETNALNGVEGFSYNRYKQMQEELFTDTPYNVIYLQEYRTLLESYEKAQEGWNSILPAEVIIYTTEFLVYLTLWCLIVVLLLAAPVMVNDVASNMNKAQYSCKIGRNIYIKQYFCMVLSALLAESSVIGIGMRAWKVTGAAVFGKAGLASFLYTAEPTLQITYNEMIGLFIVIMGLTGIGVASIVFCISSCSGNVITMLMKVTPVAVVAGAYTLGLINVFYTNNVLYEVLHIPGSEILIAGLLFAVGISFNVWNYKRIKERG